MVFKNLCVLLFRMEVASALERSIMKWVTRETNPESTYPNSSQKQAGSFFKIYQQKAYLGKYLKENSSSDH